jgi:hypothetical protein
VPSLQNLLNVAIECGRMLNVVKENAFASMLTRAF